MSPVRAQRKACKRDEGCPEGMGHIVLKHGEKRLALGKGPQVKGGDALWNKVKVTVECQCHPPEE